MLLVSAWDRLLRFDGVTVLWRVSIDEGILPNIDDLTTLVSQSINGGRGDFSGPQNATRGRTNFRQIFVPLFVDALGDFQLLFRFCLGPAGIDWIYPNTVYAHQCVFQISAQGHQCIFGDVVR